MAKKISELTELTTPTSGDLLAIVDGIETKKIQVGNLISKSVIGLGNVDNTSDANKPISTATQTALDTKVDENAAIIGATKTKITYDAKGLVTAGADIQESEITFTDITDNNASTVKHGFLKKLPNNAAQFMNGVGDWATPAGAGDVSGPATNTDNYIPQWDGTNSKTLKDGISLASITPPVKASGAEITTGTDDAKFVTSKALADATVGKIGAAWASYNPTFTLTGAASQNGTKTGGYVQIGKTVHFWAKFIVAADSNFLGLSAISVSLPVAAGSAYSAVTHNGYASGVCVCNGSYFPLITSVVDSTTLVIYAVNSAGTYATAANITASVPSSWGVGNSILIQGTYEVA